MAGLGALFGSESAAGQFLLYGVAFAVGQAVLEPVLDEVRQKVLSDDPIEPLSPPDVAAAVVRNFMARSDAEREALLSGVNAGRLQTLIDLAGDAPGPDDLAIALRRQLIPEEGTGPDSTSFTQGIAEGRLADKWTPVIKGLAQIWPTPNDALDAVLEGQLTVAEGQAQYQKLGGDLQFWDWLFDTRGNAPTPVEALEMLNRGLIPESGTGPDSISYEQAFLEGPWRNKWLPVFLGLRTYVVPPRSVVAMIKEGAFTVEQATAELAKSGVSAETAAALIKGAQSPTASKAKQISETIVLDLYETQALTAEDATARLVKLGYQEADIPLLLSSLDLRREVAALQSAQTRIGTLYVARKVTRQAAATALADLKLPDAAAARLLATWDVQRASTVKQLTEAQITSGWEYQVFTAEEATAELVAIGYTPFDAWALLSIKAKGAQPNKPPQGPAGPGVVP